MRLATMVVLAAALAVGTVSPPAVVAQTDPTDPTVQTPAATTPTTIPPIVWNLIEFPGVGAINEPGRYTAQFMEDGQISIRADCNWVAGFWTAADGVLDITITRTTLVGCPPDSLEQPYVVALDNATGYSLNDFLLIIYTADGEMHFAPSMPGMA
ncbi:MAG: META domain-containing protein [Thermomicrobiales bacterium]